MAISEAHETLSDTAKRQEYDQEQRNGRASAGGGRRHGGWPGGGGQQGAGHYRRVLRRRRVTQRIHDAYGNVLLRQVWQTVETYEWVSDEPARGAQYDQHGRKRTTGSITEYILQELMVMFNDPSQLLLLVFAILGGVALMTREEEGPEEGGARNAAGAAPGQGADGMGPVQQSLHGHAPNVPALQLEHLASDHAQIVVFVPVVASAAGLRPSVAVLRAVQATAASLATHQRANKLRFAWVNMAGDAELVSVDASLHSAAVAFMTAAGVHFKREAVPAVENCVLENCTPDLGSVWVAHFTVMRTAAMESGSSASCSQQLAASARKVAVHRLEGGEKGSHHQAGHNLKEWLLQLLEGVNWSNVSSGLLVPLLEQ